MTLSRRGLLGLGAAAATSLIRPAKAAQDTAGKGAQRSTAPAAGPVAIASANGLRGVARVHELIAGGADPLDAAIAGVNIQELDPEDHSVGLGGLPNEDGVVQLDASVCTGRPGGRARSVPSIPGRVGDSVTRRRPAPESWSLAEAGRSGP